MRLSVQKSPTYMLVRSLFALAILAIALPLSGLTSQQGRDRKADEAVKPATTATAKPAHATQQGAASTGKPLVEESNKAAGREADAGVPEKKESKEEEKDEEAKFKYSASVKWLAAKTGMDYKLAYWVFVILNFAIIAGAIFAFVAKKAPGAFRNRTATIQQQIEEARKASEDANRRLSEIENKLSRLDADIATMRAEGETAAQAEAERLRAAAEEDRKKIVAQSEAEIAAAANAARRDLKSFTAELAIGLAEKRIRVDEAADQALVREFGVRMGKDGQ